MASRTIRHLRKTGSEKSEARRHAFAKKLWEKVRRLDKKSATATYADWRKKKKKHFRFMGSSYRARRLFQKGVIGTAIPDFVKARLAKKRRVRILDVGSGQGLYWNALPGLAGIKARGIKEVGQIELHTLNPSNWYSETIPTSTKRQHVGTAETKNLAKLGRFDAITAFYTIGHLPADFNQAINKLSKSLSVGGKLFVIFGHKGIQGDMTNKGIGASFGKNFKIEFLKREVKKGATYNNGLIATRTK